MRETVAQRESHAACGRDRLDHWREDIVGHNARLDDDSGRQLLGGVDVLLTRRTELHDELEVPTHPVARKYSYIARPHYTLQRS